MRGNLSTCEFCRSWGPQNENKRKWKYKDLARELKKDLKHEGDDDISCNWCVWNGSKRPRIGNQKMNRDHPDYTIVEIDQNTQKSPGDQWRLAVTQTPIKKYQGIIIIIIIIIVIIIISECKKLAQKEFRLSRTGGKDDPLRIMEVIKILSYRPKPKYILKNDTHKILWNFETQTDYLIPVKITDPKRKKTCHLEDFAVLADHRVKLKENETIDKYLDLARDLPLPPPKKKQQKNCES